MGPEKPTDDEVAAAVIDRHPRPVLAAAGPADSALFLFVGPFKRPRLPGGGSPGAAYRLVYGEREVVSQRLVARQSDVMTTLVAS
jgi:hypothetical protein